METEKQIGQRNGQRHTMTAPLTIMRPGTDLVAKRERLNEILREIGSALVAYSGGADSALLLRVASDVLGSNAAGALAVSETIPPEEVDAALAVARQMGATVHVVTTHEYENDAYRANNPDRCYHCKVALFDELEPLAKQLHLSTILYGANHDDLGDYRPGQRAAQERGVRAPLLEAGLTKAEIRALSRQLNLSTWNKPAMACLSSRVPHGTEITRDLLERIAAAERFLHQLGIVQLRVRTHDTLARIEVDADGMALLAQPSIRQEVVQHLTTLGYQFVTLDLAGFRSGSLNPSTPRQS